MNQEAPVNPLPPVVIILFLIVAVVEGLLTLADMRFIGGNSGIGWRLDALTRYSFSPAVWEQVAIRGRFDSELILRFFTYPFVHAAPMQAVFGGVILLALGKYVGEVLRPVGLLAVFIGAMVIGAVVFGMLVSGRVALYGIYTPVYGLIGAYTYLMWLRLKMMGQNQIKAFRLIGFLLGIQLVFGLLFGAGPQWIAELAGFFTGFGISILVAPGGWTGFLARLRHR
ncbi:MAG: rhomboid family intramembrane serine protease [Rhodobacteraceae bacterium]|nr:rhomboid family intramembrane serine protease [Paracoccaceae bacterium]